MENRFSVGLDFNYKNTRIKKIKDPKDLTPINGFSIRTIGIYLTASVFFGGRKTKGDKGKFSHNIPALKCAEKVLKKVQIQKSE